MGTLKELNAKAFDDFLWRCDMETKQRELFDGEITQPPQPKRRGRYNKGMGLSAHDVCAILDSCLRNSVKTFSFGGLVVEFDPHGSVEREAVGAVCSTLSSESDDRQGRRDYLASLADTVDDELEMLKITDPLQYEKLLAEQEAK